MTNEKNTQLKNILVKNILPNRKFLVSSDFILLQVFKNQTDWRNIFKVGNF